ncbi:unnamed protein product, partial [Ectocarpus sp. 8 AP-2014]
RVLHHAEPRTEQVRRVGLHEEEEEGGRIFLRGGHAQAPSHPPQGAQVPAFGQGQGRPELHDVLP